MSFKVRYLDMGSFQFQQAFTKLVNAPISPASAVLVSGLNKQLKASRAKVAEEYVRDIREIFATKDAEGKIIEGEQGFEVLEQKQEEFKKAHEEFGNRTTEFTGSPLLLKYFEGAVKLSAEEIEALGEFITMDTPMPATLRSV